MNLDTLQGAADLLGGGSGSSALPAMPGILGTLMTLVQSVMSSMAIITVLILMFIIAYWVLTGFKWLYIGRKAGLDKDWMPFVPITKALYRLKIVDEPWWMVFFLEGWWLYGSALYLIVMAISSNNWGTFALILLLIYYACCIAYNVYWRYKYYIAFNIKPHMAISILVPLTGGCRRVIDYVVAFSNNYYHYGSTAAAASIPQGAQNFVNVPKGAPGGQMAPGQPAAPGTMSGLSGMYAGQDIPLAPNEDLLIGRDSTCNLIIDRNADKLSRKHCSITYNSAIGAYMVTDFSSNGTYIDGGNRLVANMATQMQRGTVIALGNRENRFRLN